MSKSNALKAACMGASLITAWSATKSDAADFQVTAQGNLSVPVSHLHLMVGNQNVVIPDNSAGTTELSQPGLLGWAGTICLNMPDNFASQPWAIAGIGTGSLTSDVMVSLAGTLAINQPFTTVFPGVDEVTLARGISQDDRPEVDKFLLSLEATGAGQLPGLEATAILFSNGQQIGTISVSVTPAVPEPGSFGIFALTIGGLLRRIRRRG